MLQGHFWFVSTGGGRCVRRECTGGVGVTVLQCVSVCVAQSVYYMFVMFILHVSDVYVTCFVCANARFFTDVCGRPGCERRRAEG